jgi:hypothetical protein
MGKVRDLKQERITAIRRGETGVGSKSKDATRHRARRAYEKKHGDYHPMSMWTTNDLLKMEDLTQLAISEPALKKLIAQLADVKALQSVKPRGLGKPIVHARRNKQIFKPGNWNIT